MSYKMMSEKMEPDTAGLAGSDSDRFLASIAISLKRLADAAEARERREAVTITQADPGPVNLNKPKFNPL